MAGTKDDFRPKPGSHGAFGSEPPADKDALRRYTDRDQLEPQGYPADKRPTDPDAVERSDLRQRDKQYGSDDS